MKLVKTRNKNLNKVDAKKRANLKKALLGGAAIGAGALAVGAAGAAGGAAYMRRKNKPQATTTPTPQPSTKPLPPIQHKTKDPRLLKKKKLIKKKRQPMNTPNRTVKVSSDYDDF